MANSPVARGAYPFVSTETWVYMHFSNALKVCLRALGTCLSLSLDSDPSNACGSHPDPLNQCKFE